MSATFWRIAASAIPTSGSAPPPYAASGRTTREFRFEARTAAAIGARQSVSSPLYRVTFRLLTVVSDIVGYVAETDFLDIDPGDDLKRAMQPLWHLNTPTSGGLRF